MRVIIAGLALSLLVACGGNSHDTDTQTGDADTPAKTFGVVPVSDEDIAALDDKEVAPQEGWSIAQEIIEVAKSNEATSSDWSIADTVIRSSKPSTKESSDEPTRSDNPIPVESDETAPVAPDEGQDDMAALPDWIKSLHGVHVDQAEKNEKAKRAIAEANARSIAWIKEELPALSKECDKLNPPQEKAAACELAEMMSTREQSDAKQMIDISDLKALSHANSWLIEHEIKLASKCKSLDDGDEKTAACGMAEEFNETFAETSLTDYPNFMAEEIQRANTQTTEIWLANRKSELEEKCAAAETKADAKKYCNLAKEMGSDIKSPIIASVDNGVTAPPAQLAKPSPIFREGSGPGNRMPSGRQHFGTRSAVVAPNAAAATAHPLATQTALDVMKAGGTAVDAAIAANAMLGLVEPTGNGIGGDLFAIVWDPTTETLYGYNGSGRSPMGATLEDMQKISEEKNEGNGIPPFGSAPVTVPGTVDGWFALHDKFGNRSMSDNLAPAIKYARNGAPIPEVIAYYWSRGPARFEPAHESGMLEEYENAKKTYFSPPPTEGDLFRNPDLADTLERIGQNGRDEFYKGKTAKTMGDYFERINGFLRYEDFEAHEGEWVDPICVEYREEVKLCELPPNTQGIAALQMLQMLERFDLRGMGWGSADALMAQVEAKRLAFVDRARGYADPAYSGIDPETFINDDRNAKMGEGISIKKAADEMSIRKLNEADKKLEDGDTTYLTVTDESGMMVSLIQSNYRGMGSGLVADGLGFMFQDRGELFSLDADHPNVFEAGKRPFHTIIPAFAFKKNLPSCQVQSVPMDEACPYEPWLSFGLMGGGMQPQGHVQIILNLIDFDMGLQEAGDAARWEHRGGCEPTDEFEGGSCEEDIGTIHLESGIPEETRKELEERGHTVECCNANGGGYQAIMRDFNSGAWIAATEMRKDGNADGY